MLYTHQSLRSFVLLISLCPDAGWSLLAIPLFCMPTTKEVTKETMNYASVVFFGFVIIAAVWYAVWGLKNYRGPPTDAVHHDDSSITPSSRETSEVARKSHDIAGKPKSP